MEQVQRYFKCKYKSPPYNYTPGSYRVVRGGGWSSNVMDSRVVDRGGFAPDDVGSNVGFRIARTVP
ncbi:SUMF1/EgtB/PvdO family nonheme iron enzyme [Mesotoga sp. H07.pep.5.3]|uniref:SUMF1/EgtB/PvdO family nonheme iron enzyme n=1 Tax=Mesotoga sp. H07.pep.5.3 TaxID=1421003 RepID=UPI00117F4869